MGDDIDQALDEVRRLVFNYGRNCDLKCALVFPHCNNFQRFRIHQLVQDEFGDLKTFSVGEGSRRRIVVCWLEAFEAARQARALGNTINAPSSGRQSDALEATRPSEVSKQGRKQRPDQQIYIPRARRLATTNAVATVPVAAETNSIDSDCPTINSIHAEIYCQLGDDARIEEASITFPESDVANASDEFIPRTEKGILEVYDFDASLKTVDILTAMAAFRGKFELRWVDDTHALALFATIATAQQAMQEKFSILKLRPLSQATEESKAKARICFLESCDTFTGPRPETSTIVAKRMLSGALGMKMISPDAEVKEKEKLRQARIRRDRNVDED